MPRKYTSFGYVDGNIINHWGVVLDATKPTTGVVQTNGVEWIDDDINDGIDLAWEEHVEECRGQCVNCHCNHGAPSIEAERETNSPCECYGKPCDMYEASDGDHDHCGPQERGTVLIGSWKKVDGKYEPDETGEYAAIVGEIYTQVVWSKRVVKVRSLCSPCYPGQADVDPDKIVGEDEPGYWAFDLPADMYGEQTEDDEQTKE